MWSRCWKPLASRHLYCGRLWRPGMRVLAACCLCRSGVEAPRGTKASRVPQAKRVPAAFLENVGRKEIVETLDPRGHLAWPLGRGALLDLLALLGSLESLAFLDSQARLGLWERQGGLERGESGVRKENAENRAEMAFLASPAPPALLVPRWPSMSQVLDSLENKDLLDSRVLRVSQAEMVTKA